MQGNIQYVRHTMNTTRAVHTPNRTIYVALDHNWRLSN